MVAMVAHFDWKVHLLDIKAVFLNGDLLEEVYVVQFLGFEMQDKSAQFAG